MKSHCLKLNNGPHCLTFPDASFYSIRLMPWKTKLLAIILHFMLKLGPCHSTCRWTTKSRRWQSWKMLWSEYFCFVWNSSECFLRRKLILQFWYLTTQPKVMSFYKLVLKNAKSSGDLVALLQSISCWIIALVCCGRKLATCQLTVFQMDIIPKFYRIIQVKNRLLPVTKFKKCIVASYL